LKYGLAALMEALLKHSCDKKFLTILRRLLKDEFIQSVVRQIGDRGYFKDMLAYIANKVQAEEPESDDISRFIERRRPTSRSTRRAAQVWEETRRKLEQRLRVAGSDPTEITPTD